MFSFFRLDYRSLALLRILLGLVLIYDLFTYIHIAEFYLSDQGFVSRIDFLKEQANPWNWSVLYTSGTPFFVYLFLLWHFISLCCFILGYKTKLHTFFIWVQIVSLHNRNWTVLNGGDELVRCCFLLLIFLPLGKAFSLDQQKSSNPDNSVITTNSFFNLALFIQLSIMYVSSAIFKNHPIWNKDYTALHYALNLDLFVRPAGIWLRNQDFLIQPMTAFAYYFELLGPALILLGILKPLWNLSRYLVVISFIAFHLFIDTVLNVGTFPYFAIALWVAFLPSHFWEKTNIHDTFQIFVKRFLKLKKSFTQSLLSFASKLKLKQVQTILFNGLGIFLIFNLLYWPVKDPNFRFNIGQEYYPTFFQKTNRWLATYQDWHLFAPYPKIDNLWMEITGTLENGKKVDLYRLRPKDKNLTAEEVQKHYSFEKWRKILLKVENSKLHQEWLSNYYCKNWNQLAQDKFDNQPLKFVTINAHHQITQGRGIASVDRNEQSISSYFCN